MAKIANFERFYKILRDMIIKIGDKVRFLNDIGEGRVVKLLADKLVEVRTSDGWDIPYPVDELIVLPDEEGGDAYKPEPVLEKSFDTVKAPGVGLKKSVGDSPDIFLLIVQDVEQNEFSGIRFHLVNDSEQQFDFVYYRIGISSTKIAERDSLEPGMKIFLDEMNLETLSSLKGWHIQGVLSHSDQDFISPIINKYLPIQVKKLAASGAYGENDFLHEAAIVLSLIPDPDEVLEKSLDAADIKKIMKEKEQDNKNLNTPKVFKSGRRDLPVREIDLHINQLVDSVVGLSNREIVGAQMDTFHKELNQAITSNENSIVFIHGIGNGTLKLELRKSIDQEYKHCQFEDASFKEYGFGATLVRIRQNK